MKMKRGALWIFLWIFLWVFSVGFTEVYALSPSLPYVKEVYTGSAATNTTAWQDIRYVTYINYSLSSTAGAGVMTVQYSANAANDAIENDGNTNTWTATDVDSLVGSGIGKAYVRLSITCTSAPCTYTVYFTGKGLK